MSCEQVSTALSKLYVGSGGEGRSTLLDNGWRIGMFETSDRELAKERPFVLVLTRPDQREARWYLRRQEVHTKGRSMWQRDNRWRLTAMTVESVTTALEVIFADPRATAPEK